MAGNPLSSPNLDYKCNEEDGYQYNQITDKVFCSVSANLNIHLFTKHERQEICTIFPNLKITKETSTNGIETVNGSYKDIERMYLWFDDLQHRKQKSKTISIGNVGLDLQVNRQFVPVDFAKYEYFHHVFYQETEELKQLYGIRIDFVDRFDGCPYLRFVALHENSRVEKAQETFVATFQKAFRDWIQEIIDVPQKSQLDQMVQMVNEKYKRVLPKKNKNSLILRGPKQEIMEAKLFLEQVKTKLVLKPVNISIPSHTRKNGVEVDSNQFGIAREFVSKDIEEIKKKYAVLAEIRSLQAEKVNVIFIPIDPNLDYSAHAYEHFICAFQKIVTNMSTTAISLKTFDLDVKLPKLIDDLKKELCSLSFQIVDKTLIVTGLFHHVMTAKIQFHNLIDKEGGFQSRNVSKSSSSQGHSSSSRLDHHFPDQKCFLSKSVGMKEQEDACPICLEIPKKKICLEKCKHEFCKECLNTAMSHKPVCPVCNMTYGIVKGDQPEGTMAHKLTSVRLPGYSCGTVVIEYLIPDGIQGAKHPNPGRRFQGTHRRAYLPDNAEGQQVLNLLKKAFDQKLVFTVGHSHTSGANDTVTWNDIHHKTNMHGGPERYGYPDPEYLHRVRDELKAKGIQ